MARKAQGRLLALADFFELELQADLLTEEAVKTAAIEGEKLDVDAVRSSVARRLGLSVAGLPREKKNIKGLVDMLVDATSHYQTPLTARRLKKWQAGLFPDGYSGMDKIVTGKWRDGPMEVVSGPIGKRKVHYEGPPAENIGTMVKAFLEWFRNPSVELDGFIRAAISHLWFVSIHPFEDGNGRIARAVTDMALAQDEEETRRLYSMSSQIESERPDYYGILERTQRRSGEISDYLRWFLECLRRAIERSEEEANKAVRRARIWRDISHIELNGRQRTVVDRLIESGPEGFEGGLSTRKYVGMTRTSPATAKRDISYLVENGVLVSDKAGGRSANYRLAVWDEQG
jgi:Fic family protein